MFLVFSDFTRYFFNFNIPEVILFEYFCLNIYFHLLPLLHTSQYDPTLIYFILILLEHILHIYICLLLYNTIEQTITIFLSLVFNKASRCRNASSCTSFRRWWIRLCYHKSGVNGSDSSSSKLDQENPQMLQNVHRVFWKIVKLNGTYNFLSNVVVFVLKIWWDRKRSDKIKGRLRIYSQKWKVLDKTTWQAYIGLLLLTIWESYKNSKGQRYDGCSKQFSTMSLDISCDLLLWEDYTTRKKDHK